MLNISYPTQHWVVPSIVATSVFLYSNYKPKIDPKPDASFKTAFAIVEV